MVRENYLVITKLLNVAGRGIFVLGLARGNFRWLRRAVGSVYNVEYP